MNTQKEATLALDELWVKSELPLTTLGGDPIAMFSASRAAQVLFIASETRNSGLVEHFRTRISEYFPEDEYSDDHRLILRSSVLSNPALSPKVLTELVSGDTLDFTAAFSVSSNPSSPAKVLLALYERVQAWDLEQKLKISRQLARHKNSTKELLVSLTQTKDSYVLSWARDQLTARGIRSTS